MVIDFLFQLALILTLTKVLGIFVRKLGLPQVLGFIIAGLLLGPAIWEQIFDLGENTLFPIQSESNSYLLAFAEVGVIFVMFSSGLETNLKDLKETGVKSFAIAMCGVILPLLGGTLVGKLFLPSANLVTWVFIGVIMTATSVGITVEVLRELGKLTTKVGTIILSAAIIDDVLGIMVLSIVLSLSGAKSNTSSVLNLINPAENPVITVLWILAFFVFAIGVGICLSKFFRYLEKKSPHTRRIPIFSIAVCLMYSFIAEKVFGVADITGAYIAGLVLSTNHNSAQYVDRKVSISSYIIFAPIFFANIGIKISFGGLGLDILLLSVVFVLVSILTKLIGCGGMAKLLKFDNKDCARIGVGMIARGEVALIVMEKGIEGGLIGAEYRAMVVLLVLTTSIIAPIVLKMLYKDKKSKSQQTNVIESEGSVVE